MSHFSVALSLARGALWRSRRGVLAASTPRVLGARCRLIVERGAKLRLGRYCSFDRDVEIVVYRGACLELGDHVYVGHGSTIACAQSIVIGDETMIADLVSIRDMNHRRVPGRPLREGGMDTLPIRIGRNCWVASKVTLVAGVTLGDDVTVAANAVVVGSVAAATTVGGIPARPLQKRAE